MSKRYYLSLKGEVFNGVIPFRHMTEMVLLQKGISKSHIDPFAAFTSNPAKSMTLVG